MFFNLICIIFSIFMHYELLFMSVRDILLTQQRERGGRLKERYIKGDVFPKGLGSTIIKVVTGPGRLASLSLRFINSRLQAPRTSMSIVMTND